MRPITIAQSQLAAFVLIAFFLGSILVLFPSLLAKSSFFFRHFWGSKERLFPFFSRHFWVRSFSVLFPSLFSQSDSRIEFVLFPSFFRHFSVLFPFFSRHICDRVRSFSVLFPSHLGSIPVTFATEFVHFPSFFRHIWVLFPFFFRHIWVRSFSVTFGPSNSPVDFVLFPFFFRHISVLFGFYSGSIPVLITFYLRLISVNFTRRVWTGVLKSAWLYFNLLDSACVYYYGALRPTL